MRKEKRNSQLYKAVGVFFKAFSGCREVIIIIAETVDRVKIIKAKEYLKPYPGVPQVSHFDYDHLKVLKVHSCVPVTTLEAVILTI